LSQLKATYLESVCFSDLSSCDLLELFPLFFQCLRRFTQGIPEKDVRDLPTGWIMRVDAPKAMTSLSGGKNHESTLVKSHSEIEQFTKLLSENAIV